MGVAWAVFMPCLIVLAGLVVRLAMAHLSGERIASMDIANIAVKGWGWAFFVGALGFATNSLVGNANLVTKIYFPREVLPLASVLAQAFDTTVGLVVLALVLPFLGVGLHASLLWLPVLLLLLFCFTTALSLVLASANLFYRDIKYIVQVILMFGIFFTPVFFEPAMLGATGSKIMMFNPLTPILEGLRQAVVDGHNLSGSGGDGPQGRFGGDMATMGVSTCAVACAFGGLLAGGRHVQAPATAVCRIRLKSDRLMSEIAVQVDSVWKKFRRGERQDSLRDLVPALVREWTGRKSPNLRKSRGTSSGHCATFRSRRGAAKRSESSATMVRGSRRYSRS